jgi:hypothetical protein
VRLTVKGYRIAVYRPRRVIVDSDDTQYEICEANNARAVMP